MGFFRGLGKITGIITTAVGLVGVATGGALFGIGYNKEYTATVNTDKKATIGVGASNWGELISFEFNGQEASQTVKDLANKTIKGILETAKIDSYSKFVNNFADKAKEDMNLELEKPDSLSEAIGQAYGMYAAGISMLVIFGIAFLVGIILLLLSKKKK